MNYTDRNEKLGLQYRNRIAKFVNKMSHTPKSIVNYKSNPLARDANADESKLTTFAVDPTLTRTGMVSWNQ